MSPVRQEREEACTPWKITLLFPHVADLSNRNSHECERVHTESRRRAVEMLESAFVN